MKARNIIPIAMLLVLTIVVIIITRFKTNKEFVRDTSGELQNEGVENEAEYHYMRWKYEADMIKDPTTGKALFGLRDQEISFARTIPVRNSTSSGMARLQINNNYLPAGPNNQGGRTRGLAYDIRYDGATNRVILAGGVSGGIFRSADGGSTWIRVTPANEYHVVSCITQDPRSGFQNTWYAGGGEYVGNSAEDFGAGYLSHGMLKSTDNGITWTRLALTNITDFNGLPIAAGVAERFDHPFDYVHKISINPVNGDVYVACHRRIVRSQNGGTTFQTVFGSAVTAVGYNGMTDVVVSSAGKVYVAFAGSAPDLTLRGIWKSDNGNLNNYNRIAGGTTIGVDSLDGWRGNSYNLDENNAYYTRRTLLALAPSNEKILYVLYENGLSNTSSPEADLFKLDMTSGNNIWTNLSANVPNFPGGDHPATDPFTIQGGYDLFIAVKPNDPNFVLLGGTSLYRSTDGFSTANYDNTLCWIGGYGRNTLPSGLLSFYSNSHPDIHNVVFNPSNSNIAICANDGGLQVTNNITAAGSTVSWTNINNYQTLQYYYVAIDPEIGANNFAGGAQDNGTQFRDKTGVIGLAAIDSNNHRRVIGGDGSSVGISKKNGSGVQFLYGGVQFGTIRRGQIVSSLGVPSAGSGTTEIQPNNNLTPGEDGFGEYVTNFKLNPDNTEDLFYVNFNRLFRTTNASTVTSSTWTELTAVGSTLGTNLGIRAMAFSRGNYGSSNSMYLGTTNGKIYRLDDPRNVAPTIPPIDISPPGIAGLNVQDIAVNPNNDNEIIAVISNYGFTNASQVFLNVDNIWWTNNAKSATPTWKKAEGNLTGTLGSATVAPTGLISARSCMITVKKDASGNAVTEYYVGTAAGLYAVENLGTTLIANGTPNWLRDGSSTLNFAVISSLAYRPADNVLLVGTHGNGLYYTFLGTPNLITGINNPVLNDKEFITMVYPTVTSSTVQYRIGNKTDVKKISIQLYNMQGQQVYRQETGYQNGSVNLSRFSKGAYILSIYSDNQKYRHLQKIIR